jgi:integrase
MLYDPSIPSLDLYAASEPIAPPTPGAMRWPDFCTEFLGYYGPTMRARATREGMERTLKVLTELGIQSTADLTCPLIVRLIESQPAEHAGITVRSLLTRVSAICAYAKDTGRIPVSPFAIRRIGRWVRGSKRLPKNETYLTRDEMRRLFEVLALDVAERRGLAAWKARRLQALVATVAYVGLRRDEALYLKMQSIALVGRTLDVVDRASDHRLKTDGSNQVLVLPIALVPILEAWFSHRMSAPPGVTRPPSEYVFCQWSVATPWTGGKRGHKPLDRFQAIAERAGIDRSKATWQALRRTLATHMEEHCSDAMIARQLRHTSPETAKRHYRQRDIDNLHSAMDDFAY